MATADGSELIYVSPAFETLYGRSSAEFHRELGLWLDCVHPEDREHAAASRQQLAALGHSVCEYRICRPDGSVRWLSDRKCKIIDDTGRVTMIGGIAEDITVLKERDAALATTQAQLEAMVAERTIALQRVNAELDSFARTAAHDMKSPLHAIAGFSQLVQLRYGEALGPEGRRMVARIEQSAFDMSTLVNDLLTLSRMTTTELCLTEVDLAALAGEIIEALRQQEPQRVVSFEAPPRAIVRCDAGLAGSLMSNLLGNAWKFTGRREQGRICLAVHESARGTVISVEDNGAGFDTSKSEQLFRPFQRLHSASEFAGTGLGLATCQRIVHRHGGEIWASSTPGLGTTLSFTMAATPRPHGADAAADLLQRAAANVGPSPAGLAGGARGDALLAPAAD
jgi:PAS domain S-box-containing protein